METGHHPHRNRHVAERIEKMVGVLMVVAVALLALGMIYGVMSTDSTPSYLR